jgi:hypothetical protein
MRRADLTAKTPKELRQLALHLSVDIRGCLEKNEIVECIAAAPRVSIIKAEDADLDLDGGSTSVGLRILCRSELDEMSVEETARLMEELGVDSEGCHEKLEMEAKLLLSGRAVVAAPVSP